MCSDRLFYTINLAQLLNDFIVKTFTLVTVDYRWDSISVKPCTYQGFGYSFCLLIGVTTAALNLDDTLVITRTFSFPSLLGSTFMKSVFNRSMGLLAIIDPCDGIWINIWTLGSLTPLTVFTQLVMSWSKTFHIPTVAYTPLPDDPVGYEAVLLLGP